MSTAEKLYIVLLLLFLAVWFYIIGFVDGEKAREKELLSNAELRYVL